MNDETREEIPKEAGGEARGGPPAGVDKPRRRGRLIAIGAAVALLLGGGTLAFYTVPAFHNRLYPRPSDNAARTARGEVKYTCGMHPFIISDKPGQCPICGMTLTKIEGAGPAAAGSMPAPGNGAGNGERKILFYRHPMNPGVTSPVPAKDEMGMDYIPVYEEEVAGGAGAVAGYSTIKVGAESLRLAGVQTAPAAREKISRSVRAVGNVLADERRIRRVNTKIEGWIEKLHVSFTGQFVSKGQPLLDIYSPELVASQREHLIAIGMRERMKSNPYPEEKEMAEQLVRSSRRRLELFDVPPDFIARLESTGNPRRTVTLDAPTSGYVTAKDVFEGTRIMPGMELFTVTDLSRIWIEADLYEYEAMAVRVGQQAVLTPAYDAGRRLKGSVTYVYPTLSPESRTLKVRFEFPNPGMRLKPQMYADVSLELDAATGVVIPDSAVIETGLRQIVFVDLGGGTLEPREVKVGIRSDGKAQILSGVKEGERVAVRANFLLDSESRLRAALTGMAGGAAPSPPGEHSGHGGAR